MGHCLACIICVGAQEMLSNTEKTSSLSQHFNTVMDCEGNGLSGGHLVTGRV